ncbi:hypothetical protein JCM8097_002835 [Rhodosporidiobolus ruineniae]
MLTHNTASVSRRVTMARSPLFVPARSFNTRRFFRHDAARPSSLASTASSSSSSGTVGLSPALRAPFERLQHAASANPRRAKIAGGVALAVLEFSALALSPKETDPIVDRENPADAAVLKTIPLTKLLNGWFVYGCVSVPILVDMSDMILKVGMSVPLVSTAFRWFIRNTFFYQFLAGETTEEALPRIAELRQRSIGTLLGYNIEALEGGAAKPESLIRTQLEETFNAIKTNGSFGASHASPQAVASGDTRSWVRIKLTGLIADPKVIRRASDAILANRAANGTDKTVYFPGAPVDGDWDYLFSRASPLSEQDRTELLKLYAISQDLMHAGQKYSVRVIVDAEQTWYQPLIDVATEELMREFNTGKDAKPPVVVASFQAYLRRNSDLIMDQLERAQKYGYKLLIKQIRGAYHPYEVAKWTEGKRAGPPPVWSTKPETDQSYYDGMELGCKAIRKHIDQPLSHADLGFIAATHNELSVDQAFELISKHSLGEKESDGSYRLSDEVSTRLSFAQLYGMKDNLTNRIAGMLKSETGLPLVCKSMSYGDLDEALPFLARRAIENKAIMEGRGGASSERKRLGKEIARRLLPWRE